MTHTVQLRKFSAMIEAIVHSLVFKKDCEAKIEFLSLNLILNKFCEMNKTPVLPVKTGLWPQPPSLLHSGSPGRYACATSFPLRSSHASSHYCHFIHPNLFRTNNKNNSSIHCVSNIYNSNPHKEDLLVVFGGISSAITIYF